MRKKKRQQQQEQTTTVTTRDGQQTTWYLGNCKGAASAEPKYLSLNLTTPTCVDCVGEKVEVVEGGAEGIQETCIIYPLAMACSPMMMRLQVGQTQLRALNGSL